MKDLILSVLLLLIAASVIIFDINAVGDFCDRLTCHLDLCEQFGDSQAAKDALFFIESKKYLVRFCFSEKQTEPIHDAFVRLHGYLTDEASADAHNEILMIRSMLDDMKESRTIGLRSFL